ncbi:unnamed protein product [Adineta steineri]|uniref:Uncharacterized protein n=1 Tax=Adineta steineri TaxID=433720 RepID=A0A819R5F7_9BILA|nr:unnamed protein product [Adineta steineri]CAF4040427.1 unnamed protein product [Adineta steineri]
MYARVQVDTAQLLTSLLIRILSIGFLIDPTTILWFCCKTRMFFAEFSILVALGFYIPVVIGILPIITMIIFALLAFISIRTIASRNIHIERLGRDRQLTAVTLIYVVFIMFFYYVQYAVRNQVIYVLIDVHFKRFQQAANNLNNHQVTPGIEINNNS